MAAGVPSEPPVWYPTKGDV